jgi:hypothetical protein
MPKARRRPNKPAPDGEEQLPLPKPKSDRKVNYHGSLTQLSWTKKQQPAESAEDRPSGDLDNAVS